MRCCAYFHEVPGLKNEAAEMVLTLDFPDTPSPASKGTLPSAGSAVEERAG